MFTDGSPERILLAGTFFTAGQAEKVYSGACPAAMARPSPEYYDAVCASMQRIAELYALKVVTLPYLGEIWICRKEYVDAISRMSELELNSPVWHFTRARLCGIPSKEIDEEFHLRQGYNEPTDRL